MAKYVNSFSLLDDEEEDDITSLVDHLAKKVDEKLLNVQKYKENSQHVQNGSVGSESKDDHSSRDGNRDPIEDGAHLQGEGSESNGVDQTEIENDGWQEVSRSNAKGQANNRDSLGERQWRIYRFKNSSHRGGGRAYVAQFRGNGDHSYGGERKGNGDNDGKLRNRNGDQGGYGGGRGGYYKDEVQDHGGGYGKQNGEGVVFEENKGGGEERNYRGRNWNYGGERRGRGGYRGGGGRGKFEYRRTGSGEVKEVGNTEGNVNGGDVAPAVNALEAATVEEEKNTSDVINGDVRDPKEQNKSDELDHKRKEYEEARRKNKADEEKEAALMTLDQYYEKVRSEKKKMQPVMTEVRKVTIDKDFEKMQVIERKKEDIDERWVSIQKPKTTDSVKVQVSESLKTVNGSDSKLKIEGITKKAGNFGKEKGRKVVFVEAHEILTSAFRPRRFRGRGGGGGGGGGGDRGDHHRNAGGRGGGDRDDPHRNAGGGGGGDRDDYRRNAGGRGGEDPPRHGGASPPQPEDFPSLVPAESTGPLPPLKAGLKFGSYQVS